MEIPSNMNCDAKIVCETGPRPVTFPSCLKVMKNEIRANNISNLISNENVYSNFHKYELTVPFQQYGAIGLCQHWLKWWLIATRQQAIMRSDVDVTIQKYIFFSLALKKTKTQTLDHISWRLKYPITCSILVHNPQWYYSDSNLTLRLAAFRSERHRCARNEKSNM